MAIPTYNPMSFLEADLTAGLDYMIANLPGSPTFQDIIDTTVDYFNSLPAPPDATLISLLPKIISTNANNFINTKIADTLDFDGNALALVDSVLSGIKDNTIDSLAEFLSNTDEQLATTCSNINSISLNSLYAASALAKGSNAYWQTKALTPGSWSTYLKGNVAIDYSYIPHYVITSYVSALGGYAQAITSTNINMSFNVETKFAQAPVLALGTAIAITTGKIILKWPQRPAASCV